MRRLVVLVLTVMLFVLPTTKFSIASNYHTANGTRITNNAEVSSDEVVWHHDCSNITGWIFDPDPVQSRIDTVQDDIQIHSDGTSIYSGPIPSDAGSYHGALWFYELEKPVLVGYGLNIEVAIEHPGSPNYMGGVEVGFYDQYGYLTYWVSLIDVWYSSSLETQVGYYEDGNYYHHVNSQSGSLSLTYVVWHNSTTGTIQGEDNIGVYSICNPGEFSPDREIRSAMIKFWNKESYAYETNYVLDILLKGSEASGVQIPEGDKSKWHHDCSNTTGWLLEPSPPQPRLDGIQDDVGLLSDGVSLHSSGIPFASGRWHGTVFFYELTSPFLLGHGLSFTVQLNHPGSVDKMGGMEVGLYDQRMNVTCWVSIVDSWYSGAFTSDLGYDENGTHYIQSTSRSGSLVSEFRVWHDKASNSLKALDNQATYTLATENQFDPDREIHYIGLMFWNVEDYAYESNHVLDILIEGKLVSSLTTTIGSTTTGTGTTLDPFPSSLAIIIGGSSAVLIVIIAVVLMRNRSGFQDSAGQYNW